VRSAAKEPEGICPFFFSHASMSAMLSAWLGSSVSIGVASITTNGKIICLRGI
jgi:hypothetical protein